MTRAPGEKVETGFSRNRRDHKKNHSIIPIAIAAALVLITAGCVAAPGKNLETAEPAPGEISGLCGGIAGIPCQDENAYCRYEPGACAEISDAAGICRKRPEICASVYAPVCGCDGKTYSNSCKAGARGAAVAYDGECEAGE